MDGLAVGGRHRLKSSLLTGLHNHFGCDLLGEAPKCRDPALAVLGNVDQDPVGSARDSSTGPLCGSPLAAPASVVPRGPTRTPNSVGGLAFTESSTVSSSSSLTETSA